MAETSATTTPEESTPVLASDLHSQSLKDGENLVTSDNNSVILRVASPRKGSDGQTYWDSVPQTFISGFQTADGRIAIDVFGQQVWLFAKTNKANSG
tara:strand:- start:436 stop:726 length:291 start_codon:yes stop_codon:yes gene_type:complete